MGFMCSNLFNRMSLKEIDDIGAANNAPIKADKPGINVENATSKTKINLEKEQNLDNDKTTGQEEITVWQRVWAAIYGQCIGDAIGLLTEFMTKKQALKIYGKLDNLEYEYKIRDRHRERWEQGDWTDDTDQMILIMDSLLENEGEVKPSVFATKLFKWVNYGFPDLGDKHGLDIGTHTYNVLSNRQFQEYPQEISKLVWEATDCCSAPNGGVMRTSIMGIHQFWDVDEVIKNAEKMCQVTHFDPRCVASAVAVSVAISLMLRRQHYNNGEFDVKEIINDVFERAKLFLVDEFEHYKTELRFYLDCEDIEDLGLSDYASIGYTFKCLGAGFWALKQNDFRNALQTITMCGGDADTNGAVAGSLLACKLGFRCFPESWVLGLKHKEWLDMRIVRFQNQFWRNQRAVVP